MKQITELMLITLDGTGSGVVWSFKWTERNPGTLRKPTCTDGRPAFPITYSPAMIECGSKRWQASSKPLCYRTPVFILFFFGKWKLVITWLWFITLKVLKTLTMQWPRGQCVCLLGGKLLVRITSWAIPMALNCTCCFLVSGSAFRG